MLRGVGYAQVEYSKKMIEWRTGSTKEEDAVRIRNLFRHVDAARRRNRTFSGHATEPFEVEPEQSMRRLFQQGEPLTTEGLEAERDEMQHIHFPAIPP